MERRAFLGSLAGPVVAACSVCMAACSKSGAGTSTNNTPNTPQVPVNFNVNLDTSLLTIGASLVQSGVIVVRLASGNTPGSFTAVQVACTHEGTAINFNAGSNNFVCPNHGSTFTTAGAVTVGPATSALKKYTINISGSTMTVTG